MGSGIEDLPCGRPNRVLLSQLVSVVPETAKDQEPSKEAHRDRNRSGPTTPAECQPAQVRAPTFPIGGLQAVGQW